MSKRDYPQALMGVSIMDPAPAASTHVFRQCEHGVARLGVGVCDPRSNRRATARDGDTLAGPARNLVGAMLNAVICCGTGAGATGATGGDDLAMGNDCSRVSGGVPPRSVSRVAAKRCSP